MLRTAIVALMVLVALAGVQAQMEDLSLLQLSSLPAMPTHSASEQSVIDRLHNAAGDWADEAIAEAVHDLPSENGSLLEASHAVMHSKWDESIPEVHLHLSTAPEDKLLHGLVASTAEPATSASEIQQIMESFQTPALIEAKAKAQAAEAAQAAAQAKAQAAAKTVVATEATVDSASDAEILTDAEADAGVVTMSELKNMMELEGMTAQQIDQYMENLGNTEVEAEAATTTETEAEAEAETEVDAEAQTEAVASAEAEGEAEMDAETEATTEAEAEATEEVGMVETESETEAETESESEAESESDAESESEAVPVHDHADPTTLSESAESSVTPVHSAEYERRMHPAIRAVRNSGYAAPSFMQTAQRTRVVAAAATRNPAAFNPQSVQLGPSRDAYGYVPMTGAQFLRSPPQPSLAQVSVQYQNQGAQWLPPPIESQAVPNFVVGPGGLRPNVNAGPYAGQYGIAAGGIEMHQEPQFAQ